MERVRFCEGPETFNSINMRMFAGKFVTATAAICEASESTAKSFTIRRVLASEILERRRICFYLSLPVIWPLNDLSSGHDLKKSIER